MKLFSWIKRLTQQIDSTLAPTSQPKASPKKFTSSRSLNEQELQLLEAYENCHWDFSVVLAVEYETIPELIVSYLDTEGKSQLSSRLRELSQKVNSSSIQKEVGWVRYDDLSFILSEADYALLEEIKQFLEDRLAIISNLKDSPSKE